MSYQVIARKWRPKSFNELVGQEHIAKTLLNALKNQRVPQAILFTGTRGVGKTSSARIFAKSLRCTQPDQNYTPCNTCENCKEIHTGSGVDVIEIDGASNNGVDAIRELRDSVSYMPARGKYKIYIIDEVHMLSNSAFNALLKTLEEPPAHVIFIFATTEVNKIPNTILSRCQRFDFRRITSKVITQHLKHICAAENVNATEDALWLIARQADGSMRDGLSLLDQIITFSESNISKEMVLHILGLTDRQLLHDLLLAFAEQNSELLFSVLNKIKTAGLDPLDFTKELLEEIRNLLILKLEADKQSELLDLPESELSLLQDLAQSFKEENIHLLFDMALKGASDISRAFEPNLVLEMLLLRMLNAPRIEFFVSGEKSSPKPLPAVKKNTLTPKKVDSPPKSPKPIETAPVPKPTIKSFYDETKSLIDNWRSLISAIKSSNPLLAAKLEHAAPIKIEDNCLHLGFQANQEFLLSQLKEQDGDLISFIKKYWIQDLSLNLQIQKNSASEKHISPAQALKIQKQKNEQKLKEEIFKHPLVKATNDVFETSIRSIKERNI